jgi:hypothetical protein
LNHDDERDYAEEVSNDAYLRSEEVSELFGYRIYESGGEYVACHLLRSDGLGHDESEQASLWESIRAILFGYLVELAREVVKHYASDLYHDARWIHENVTGETTFYFATRDAGTSIGTDVKLVGYIAHDTLYRVDIIHNGRGGWYAGIGKVSK